MSYLLYRNLFRGVAERYAFSRFHDNVGFRDFPAIRHIERANAVVVDHNTLIGNAVLLFSVVHLNVVDQLRDHTLCNGGRIRVPPSLGGRSNSVKGSQKNCPGCWRPPAPGLLRPPTITVQRLKKIRKKLYAGKHAFNANFVKGKGHRESGLQKAVETINDWLERLKRYNLDIHICGDRNSYSKTDSIDLYLEKILFKTFRQMER